MDIKDLLSAEAVLELREPDKRRVMAEMARRAAAMLGLDPDIVLKALLKREDLGSTGLGNGIALPHARIAELTRTVGLFALLKPSIQFDAIDEQPVDLVFLLLLPEALPKRQLEALACVARRLRDPVLTGKLRTVRGSAAIHALLTEP